MGHRERTTANECRRVTWSEAVRGEDDGAVVIVLVLVDKFQVETSVFLLTGRKVSLLVLGLLLANIKDSAYRAGHLLQVAYDSDFGVGEFDRRCYFPAQQVLVSFSILRANVDDPLRGLWMMISGQQHAGDFFLGAVVG